MSNYARESPVGTLVYKLVTTPVSADAYHHTNACSFDICSHYIRSVDDTIYDIMH